MALADNLIAAWELNESSGDAVDALGANTLPQVGTVSTGTGKVYATARGSYSASNYFSLADNAALSLGSAAWTIEAWVRMPSLVAAPFVAKGWQSMPDANSEFFFGYRTTTARFSIFVSSGTLASNVDATSFGAPVINTWYHVMAWRDPSVNQLGIAVNAGTANTVGVSSVNDGNRPWTVGAAPLQGTYWPGLIGPMRFWKRTLTSGERTQLYNGGAGLAYSAFGSVAPMAHLHLARMRG